ncbi:hypothetical protein Poli38472_002215 [Pythium oligandrum]|uniref:PPM-type phosphatase domain-containing protein n=1 Tax=Pythium oligandrum TaxID=41045 RepID=A0A8K1CHR1_PYTOL|nr:hypothetical protein Poli38472_002215 [Pythium oligandrum]|eukprot:TMW63274.1 hypothetical protein Poli38472_002215 [Pythium oligandrum]
MPVHASGQESLGEAEEHKDDKTSFLSRKFAGFLRRSSAVNAVRPDDQNVIIPANSIQARIADRRRSSPARIITAVDEEIVFGVKNYAANSSNAARAVNEDRYRIISSLELYGKALVTSDKRVQSYQDALDKQLLECYANEGNVPKMDLKKLAKYQSGTNTEFFGIFDGHGGDHCSSFLALLFPLYLLLTPDFHENMPAAATKACTAINTEILKREEAKQRGGGSTGLVVMIRDGIAYVCNVGDCRAILISKSGVSALSTDHKATNESEKQRIEDAGGMVLYVKGVARVNGRLAVSRAFGDAEHHEYVIAEPEITTHSLSPCDEYIVLASDGLWDVLSNEDVMATIRNHPWLSIDEITQVLIDRAMELGTMDNVTVVIIDVRKR